MTMYKNNCFYHDTKHGKASECRWFIDEDYGRPYCILGFRLQSKKSKTYIHKYSTSDYDFYGASEGVSHHKKKESEIFIPQPLKCRNDNTTKKIEQIIDDTRLRNKQEQKEKKIKKLMTGGRYKENLELASRYCKNCSSAAIALVGYNSCRNIYRSCRKGDRRVCGYQDPDFFKNGNCSEYGKEKHEKIREEEYATF